MLILFVNGNYTFHFKKKNTNSSVLLDYYENSGIIHYGTTF